MRLPTRTVLALLTAAAMAPAASAQIVFEPPVAVDAGPYLLRTIAGDVDEDGLPDLVATHWLFGGGTTLHRGLGGGAFAPGVPALAVPGGFAASSLADFDGDTHLDLVVLGTTFAASQNKASVWFGDGRGNFGDGRLIVGTYSNAVDTDVGDFNGDGKLDLAVSNGTFGFTSGSILAVLGNGDRTFSDAVALTTLGQVIFGASPVVRVGDVNGDGLDDIAYTAAVGSPVRLSVGDGTFTTPACSGCTQITDRDFVLADVNGDGKDDAVTCARVLPALPGGAFGAGQVLAPALAPFAVDAADFDGDGRLDVAIGRNYVADEFASATFGDVLVLRGNGDGTFQTPGLVVSHVPQPRGLVAADLDADGRPDLAVAEFEEPPSSALRVLLNHTYGAGSPFLDLGKALAGTNGAPIQLASGTLLAGAPFSFRLASGPEGGTAYHIVGLSALNAPFKGGTLIPALSLINGPLPLDGSGGINLAGNWVFGGSGLTVWLQFWMPAGGGPHGLVASNGVRAQIP